MTSFSFKNQAFLGGLTPAAQSNPFVTLRTTAVNTNFTFTLMTSTGYAKAEWWDGTSTVLGTGNPNNSFNFSKTLPSTSGISRDIIFYPSNSSGVLSGLITDLFDVKWSIVNFINIRGAAFSNELSINNSLFQYLDIDETSITYLTLQNTQLSVLNIGSAPLSSGINLTRNTNLTSLELTNKYITGANYARQNTRLQYVNLSGSSISNIWLDYCALTSVRAVNTILTSSASAGYWGSLEGTVLRNNFLSASALNQFFTDLGPAPVGATPFIFIGNNPGTFSCDKTIATSKGYTVLES